MNFCCLLCSGTEPSAWLAGCPDYYLGSPGRTDYLQCLACGLVQQHPRPEKPEALYENYPVHSEKTPLHDWLRRHLFKAVYFDSSGLSEETSLLDFGCGDGWFLDSQKGRIRALNGYEPDPHHAEFLAQRLGLPVFSDLEHCQRSCPNGFDVVTLHFVLEHVADPRRCLQQIRALLKPGGRVYLLVPEIHSWEARLFRRKWHGLDAPRHLSFPNGAVMARLAQEEGFELVSLKPVAFPNTLAASLATVCCGRFIDPIFKLFLPLAWLIAKLFPGGSMAYSLRIGRLDSVESCQKSMEGTRST